MLAKIALVSIVLAGVAAKDDLGYRYLLRVYDECSNSEGVMPCFKKKAILFFDRAAKMEKIPLLDGVDIVKVPGMEGNPMNENEIDATLPRSLTEKNPVLTKMLWDRIASFANSRIIQLSMPKMSGQELGRGMEEARRRARRSRDGKRKRLPIISAVNPGYQAVQLGRGKMKKMMGMMMMGASMKMVAMIPLAIAGLFVLAGKALIVSKIALLLAGIMLLKKLMSQKGSAGPVPDSYSNNHGWSSGGSSGGWDRRASTELAYSAYNRS